MNGQEALADLLSHDRELLVADEEGGLVSAEAYEALVTLRDSLATVLGFTGTRNGMTATQSARVTAELSAAQARGADRFLHGCCVGADEQAARAATRAGLRSIGLPCAPQGHPDRAFVYCDTLFSIRPPLKRNRMIANACHRLIAAPKHDRASVERRALERGCPIEKVIVRSGTWATVRYAVTARKPVLIVWPDGSTTALA